MNSVQPSERLSLKVFQSWARSDAWITVYSSSLLIQTWLSRGGVSVAVAFNTAGAVQAPTFQVKA